MARGTFIAISREPALNPRSAGRVSYSTVLGVARNPRMEGFEEPGRMYPEAVALATAILFCTRFCPKEGAQLSKKRSKPLKAIGALITRHDSHDARAGASAKKAVAHRFPLGASLSDFQKVLPGQLTSADGVGFSLQDGDLGRDIGRVHRFSLGQGFCEGHTGILRKTG